MVNNFSPTSPRHGCVASFIVPWAARAGGYHLNPDCSLRARFWDKILASVRER
jgi:hypothetical protein